MGNPVERAVQPLAPDGLQQVVDGVHIERPHRVLVVRGHEDHHRHAVRADGVDNLEAVHAWHLDIE